MANDNADVDESLPQVVSARLLFEYAYVYSQELAWRRIPPPTTVLPKGSSPLGAYPMTGWVDAGAWLLASCEAVVDLT